MSLPNRAVSSGLAGWCPVRIWCQSNLCEWFSATSLCQRDCKKNKNSAHLHVKQKSSNGNEEIFLLGQITAIFGVCFTFFVQRAIVHLKPRAKTKENAINMTSRQMHCKNGAKKTYQFSDFLLVFYGVSRRPGIVWLLRHYDGLPGWVQ